MWEELKKRIQVPSPFNRVLPQWTAMTTTSEKKAVGNTLVTLRSDMRPVKGVHFPSSTLLTEHEPGLYPPYMTY